MCKIFDWLSTHVSMLWLIIKPHVSALIDHQAMCHCFHWHSSHVSMFWSTIKPSVNTVTINSCISVLMTIRNVAMLSLIIKLYVCFDPQMKCHFFAHQAMCQCHSATCASAWLTNHQFMWQCCSLTPNIYNVMEPHISVANCDWIPLTSNWMQFKIYLVFGHEIEFWCFEDKVNKFESIPTWLYHIKFLNNVLVILRQNQVDCCTHYICNAIAPWSGV